jgi:hypothetical protein
LRFIPSFHARGHLSRLRHGASSTPKDASLRFPDLQAVRQSRSAPSASARGVAWAVSCFFDAQASASSAPVMSLHLVFCPLYPRSAAWQRPHRGPLLSHALERKMTPGRSPSCGSPPPERRVCRGSAPTALEPLAQIQRSAALSADLGRREFSVAVYGRTALDTRHPR